MLEEKIADLKELLNHMVGSTNYTYGEILEVSQRLDILIVQYYSAL